MKTTVVAATLLSSSAQALKTFSLHDVDWTLSNCDGTVKVPGSMPGEVHTDLMQADLISHDPYFRFNELNMSWVATEDCWHYESAPFSLELDGDLYLRLQNVDSIASVYLNDFQIGDTYNTFRTFSFHLSEDTIKSTGNTLKITLWGVTDYVKEKYNSYPYVVPETVNYNVWAEPSSR
jgi:beta-mannosidase